MNETTTEARKSESLVDPTRPTSLLHLEGITKIYPSGLKAVNGVGLDVEPGERICIVGPSGSGKSSFLRCCNLLETPTSGRIEFKGTTIFNRKSSGQIEQLPKNERYRFRSKLTMVFQQFDLFPHLTALENVQVPLELRGEPDAAARARELLERVGLSGRGHHFPAQLSGGEQQRVAIARAFVNAPRILFADEPTGNLDASTGARIVELLEALNRESGTTIVLVTHDLALAGRAQRVIRLADGAVVSDSGAAAATPAE